MNKKVPIVDRIEIFPNSVLHGIESLSGQMQVATGQAD